MLALFQRMSKSILAVLGEDALFSGTVRTKINVENGVEFVGTDGDRAAYRGDTTVDHDLATIGSEVQPREGETFQFIAPGTWDAPLGKTYRLEKLVKDNGVNRSFVALEVD